MGTLKQIYNLCYLEQGITWDPAQYWANFYFILFYFILFKLFGILFNNTNKFCPLIILKYIFPTSI